MRARASATPSKPREVRLSRSEVVGKPVITRTSGLKLGVARQAWVDLSRWELVSLEVAPNALSIADSTDAVLLQSLRQVGDVILVHDESVLESNLGVYGLDALVGSEVITESGEFLGRARDYVFSPESGKVVEIVFDSLGLPLVPDSILSTYALKVEEVVSAGPGRIIASEGAERRLEQLTSGIVERIGIEPPWAQSYGYDAYDYDTRYYERPSPRRDAEQASREPTPRQKGRNTSATRQPSGYTGPESEGSTKRNASRWATEGMRRSNPATTAGSAQIPLYDLKDRRPAYQRQDADGGLGDAPSRGNRKPPTRRFDDWVVQERQRSRELEEAGLDADAIRSSATSKRRIYDASEDRI